MIAKLVNKVLEYPGYKLIKLKGEKLKSLDIDKDIEFLEIYAKCREYTMTSVERMYALYNATNYVLDKGIKGDFVECGVWKGGSAMLIAHLLSKKNVTDRRLYLYDTFEGMPSPSEDDISIRGFLASKVFEEQRINADSSSWCYAAEEEVRINLQSTGIKSDQLVFIKGKVEETIPSQLPADSISLLRLDTDWYSSTKHELVHLYPMLQKGGVLIIDDFGDWEGAKKAVIEYFDSSKLMLLNRIDHTGRIGIKL